MATKMTVVKPTGWTVKVSGGKYFLGDPCYAVPEEDWMPLLRSCGFFNESPVGEVRGHQVLGFRTRWGDGGYFDKYGHSYSVDSGLIGLVPEPLHLGTGRYNLARLGRFVEFAEPTTCTTDGTVLRFGHITIDTTA